MRQPKTFNDVVLLVGCEGHANSPLAQNGGNGFSPAQLFRTDRNHKINIETLPMHRVLFVFSFLSFFFLKSVKLLLGFFCVFFFFSFLFIM